MVATLIHRLPPRLVVTVPEGDSAEPEPRTAAELGRAQESGPGPRIMLADDDRGFREMLRDLLSDEGYEIVAEAADGAEAVALAPEAHPDVLFMDLRMPQLDGIEAARVVKSVLPSAQVIILSAYEDPGLKRGAEQAGVFCYLIKGCPPQMIRDMLAFAWNYKQGLDQRSTGADATLPSTTTATAPSEEAPDH
jgi:two-component system chemotaxis response regulator CheY